MYYILSSFFLDARNVITKIKYIPVFPAVVPVQQKPSQNVIPETSATSTNPQKIPKMTNLAIPEIIRATVITITTATIATTIPPMTTATKTVMTAIITTAAAATATLLAAMAPGYARNAAAATPRANRPASAVGTDMGLNIPTNVRIPAVGHTRVLAALVGDMVVVGLAHVRTRVPANNSNNTIWRLQDTHTIMGIL